MSVLWHTKPSESRVDHGIRLDLALGRERLEPRREYGTGLRRRLEAHGVPLFAALPPRSAPTT